MLKKAFGWLVEVLILCQAVDNIGLRPIIENLSDYSTLLEPKLIQQDYFKDLYVDVDLPSAYARTLCTACSESGGDVS